LSKLSKRRQIYVIYPHSEEVRGGVESWWTARRRVLVKCIIKLLFLSLTAEALQGKTCQDCYQEGVGHSEPRFQWEGVVFGEYFFGFYKTRHILLFAI